MKYLIHFLILIVLVTVSANSQELVNFSLKDCSNNDQSLFSSLDQGKVCILIYEHRCNSCTIGATNIKNVLNKYFSGNQNIELMYLDNGGNTCQTINNWISKNNLLTGTIMQYSKDYNSPYGQGMPVIIVAGGKEHKKYLQANGVAYADENTLHNALNSALADLSDVSEGSTNANDMQIRTYPWSSDMISISFSQVPASLSVVEIISVDGNVIKSFDPQVNNLKNFELPVYDLSSGIYFLHVASDKETFIRKFIITK